LKKCTARKESIFYMDINRMLEIFQFDFMIRALIAGGVIGLISPLIGNFLVVRRYSLMADTLAHVALAGVAIGLLTGQQPVAVAVATTIIAAVLIDRLRDRKRIYSESVLAIFLSGSLAIAVVLMSVANGLNTDLLSVLFGSIATVTTTDLYYIVTLGVVVLATIALLYKELFLVSFDEDIATASGLRTRLLNLVTVVLAAITVALSMRIVGVLLIGALMVIPVVTAMQIGKGFRKTMALSVILSLLSVAIGLVAAFYLDIASGGSIVVTSLIFFIVSLILRPKQ